MLGLIPRPSMHLSIETDHFYAHELSPKQGLEVDTIGERLKMAHFFGSVMLRPGDTACGVLMIDTLNTETRPEKREFRPVEALERVIKGARSRDVQLDYIALEGSFEPLAQDVFDEMLRPNVEEDILNDSQHSDAWLYSRVSGDEYVLRTGDPCLPPLGRVEDTAEEFVYRNDMELWVKLFTYKTNRRGNVRLIDGAPVIDKWACPYLAALFLAARLGSIKHDALMPELIDAHHPPDYEQWNQYPAILQINPDADPFVADQAFSYLPRAFLGVEHGASTIVMAMDKTIKGRHHLGTYSGSW